MSWLTVAGFAFITVWAIALLLLDPYKIGKDRDGDSGVGGGDSGAGDGGGGD